MVQEGYAKKQNGTNVVTTMAVIDFERKNDKSRPDRVLQVIMYV